MKKVLSAVLMVALVFGLAATGMAMGPTAADAANVGFVLTEFSVSDSILSPLMMMNWSGTLSPSKTYGEGQAIWFVAHYVQNKIVNDGRDLTTAAGGIGSVTTTFSSKNNTVSFGYAMGYLNFVAIEGLSVVGGTVGSLTGAPVTGEVSATDAELKVTFVASSAASPDLTKLQVRDAHPTTVGNYYLQIMGFTKTCLESQGVVYAKSHVDVNEFAYAAGLPDLVTDISTLNNAQVLGGAMAGTILNVYDANYVVRYIVVKFRMPTAIANIGAAVGDSLYMVYSSDGTQIIGFISSTTYYKGMVKWDGVNLSPVQWTSDSGGKYVYTNGTGTKAVETYELQAVMDFFGFTFANSYPILDKHFYTTAGYWTVKEARYNVASAVITVPDNPIDYNVPKTGDSASTMGVMMVAVAMAAIAALGFVVTKRVRS